MPHSVPSARTLNQLESGISLVADMLRATQVQKQPGDLRAQCELGRLCHQSGDLKGAETCFQARNHTCDRSPDRQWMRSQHSHTTHARNTCSVMQHQQIVDPPPSNQSMDASIGPQAALRVDGNDYVTLTSYGRVLMEVGDPEYASRS